MRSPRLRPAWSERAEHRRVGELAAERLSVFLGIGRIERIDVERRFANPEAGPVDAHFDVVDRRLSRCRRTSRLGFSARRP